MTVAAKKLSQDDLSYVSGGSAGETADDSRFLNVLLRGKPYQCDRYGAWRIRTEDHDAEIKRAWNSVGVDVVFHNGHLFSSGSPNEYSINSKKVTQHDAMEHAMNVTGICLKKSDWDW